MKPFLLFVFSISFFCQVQSQNYIPLLQDDKIWEFTDWTVIELGHGNYDAAVGHYHIWIEPIYDTLVNGEIWRKFNFRQLYQGNSYSTPYLSENNHTEQITLHDLEHDTSYILYDFSLQLGDTFRTHWFYPDSTGNHITNEFIVSRRSEVNIGGLNRTSLALSYIKPNGSFFLCDSLHWLEGIGALNGDIYNSDRSGCYWGGTGLYCYRDDYNLLPIYGGPCSNVSVEEIEDNNAVKIFPNPSKGILTIEDLEKPSNYQLLSFHGQVIVSGKIYPQENLQFSHLPKGIYLFVLENSKPQKLILE